MNMEMTSMVLLQCDKVEQQVLRTDAYEIHVAYCKDILKNPSPKMCFFFGGGIVCILHAVYNINRQITRGRNHKQAGALKGVFHYKT